MIRPAFSFSLTLAAFGLLAGIAAAADPDDKPSKDQVDNRKNLPTSVKEARGRARWMHETIHGALQVMHRDFFGDDDTLTLPSQSLEDVFKELARSWNVEIGWLGVNATKDVDHEPKDEFEKAAAKQLKDGKPEYEQLEGNRYRFVGAIKLQNECLKCHVPYRTSLEDRVAGLQIAFDLQKEESEP